MRKLMIAALAITINTCTPASAEEPTQIDVPVNVVLSASHLYQGVQHAKDGEWEKAAATFREGAEDAQHIKDKGYRMALTAVLVENTKFAIRRVEGE